MPRKDTKKRADKLAKAEKKAAALKRFERASMAMAKAMNAAIDAGHKPGFLVEHSINLAAKATAKAVRT